MTRALTAGSLKESISKIKHQECCILPPIREIYNFIENYIYLRQLLSMLLIIIL